MVNCIIIHVYVIRYTRNSFTEYSPYNRYIAVAESALQLYKLRSDHRYYSTIYGISTISTVLLWSDE